MLYLAVANVGVVLYVRQQYISQLWYAIGAETLKVLVMRQCPEQVQLNLKQVVTKTHNH